MARHERAHPAIHDARAKIQAAEVGEAAVVEVGSRVQAGDPLGLVEVMKTFNQILYGGPGFPEDAEVVEVRAGDAEEVRAGQILMVVR